MKLFEPFEVRGTKLKNRFVRAATWLAGANPAGEVTDDLIARYEECARGGCGLILTGFSYVSREGTMLPAMIGSDDDSHIPSLKKLTDAVHAADGETKIFCQIVHTGIFRLPFVRTSYADTFAADETADPFVEMGGTGETCPAATSDQIKEIIGKWTASALRCKEAGFDGVELHFGHGFGPGAWFSPLWNNRTDDWGGDREKRARYGVEVTRAVREAVGDWPVIAKINCEDGIDGGVTVDDAVYFAGQLAAAGIDGLEVSGGSPAAGPKLGPSRVAKRGRAEGKNREGYFAEAAAAIRASLSGDQTRKIPVIGVGGWRTPAIMEQHLQNSCDAFAVCRPLLNDAGVIAKWREDPEHETGCTSCNKCSEGQGMIVCRKDA